MTYTYSTIVITHTIDSLSCVMCVSEESVCQTVSLLKFI